MGFSKLKSKESRKLPDEASKKEILVQNKMKHRMTDGLVSIRSAVLLKEVLFHINFLQETSISSQKPSRLVLL